MDGNSTNNFYNMGGCLPFNESGGFKVIIFMTVKKIH